MGYSDETWYVGQGSLNYYPCVLLLPICILITSFAYLFWLANNNKVKYSEFSMGYSDETLYVGRSALKYYPCVLLSTRILITSFAYLFWLANNDKVKYSEFYMDFSDETWYVGRSAFKYYLCVLLLSMRTSITSFAYLFWLANNNKGKYPEFYMGYSDETWYTGRSALKYYPCVLLLSMCLLITSFTYLFWLANNNKVKYPEFYIGYSNETWYVGRSALKYYPCVLLLSICILSTSFTYLFWLANNNKVKYPEFYIGYSDETWYVGSSTLKYYPCVLLSMCILITSFAYSPKAAHAVYSLNIASVSQELRNSSSVLFCFVFFFPTYPYRQGALLCTCMLHRGWQPTAVPLKVGTQWLLKWLITQAQCPTILGINVKTQLRQSDV